MKAEKVNKLQIILQNLLKEQRNLKSISQSQMAEMIGFPQSSVSKYESGERKLDVIELMMVCKALDIPLSDLIFKLEEKIKESNI